MNMYDIIMKKRGGGALSDSELHDFITGICSGEIPDYQTTALLMAIWFRGMSKRETYTLTREMERSGETVDLSAIPGLKVDKHSTGGVGDKTTLAVIPIAAACGLNVAKMSGRGLGHTGGTLDKLESIPGFNVYQSRADFIRIVREVGLCVIGQSRDLVPADKILYGLRDVTATVDSLPLIASSIMSKKLAGGRGPDSVGREIRQRRVPFGPRVGGGPCRRDGPHRKQGRKKTSALITNMDLPLGYAVGNSLEVVEAVETLMGRGREDFTAVTVALASDVLFMAGKGSRATCEKMVRQAIADKSALAKLRAMTAAEGGDPRYIDESDRFPKAAHIAPVISPVSGLSVPNGRGRRRACFGHPGRRARNRKRPGRPQRRDHSPVQNGRLRTRSEPVAFCTQTTRTP